MDQYLNSSKSHLRQTTSKIEPKPETVREIKNTDVWKMENEFYEFALQQFHFVYKSQMQIKLQGNSLDQKYFYEKIRPKQWGAQRRHFSMISIYSRAFTANSG